MKTAMQQTSLMAFLSVTDLNAKQVQVLAALNDIGPACNLDLSSYMDWPVNRITPRVLELRAKGLVEENHRAPSQTGRTAIYWRAA